jgi:hypothetical protein
VIARVVVQRARATGSHCPLATVPLEAPDDDRADAEDDPGRRGLTVLDVVVPLLVLGFVLALLGPWTWR